MPSRWPLARCSAVTASGAAFTRLVVNMPAAVPEAAIRARPYLPARTPQARTPSMAHIPPLILCMGHPQTGYDIATGHYPYQPTVLDHRKAVDPVAGHNACCLLYGVVRPDLMQVPAHHISNLLFGDLSQTAPHPLPFHQVPKGDLEYLEGAGEPQTPLRLVLHR